MPQQPQPKQKPTDADKNRQQPKGGEKDRNDKDRNTGNAAQMKGDASKTKDTKPR